MNCEEIQTQLSEYLDRSLGAAAAAVIEQHLAVCPPCRRESQTLDETIRQIAALPVVQPPLGFSQRVMAHVRETPAQPGMWQRLFWPLRVKIPIQATALVMVGILGIYLLQKDAPHKQVTLAPGTVATEQTKEEIASAIPSKDVDMASRLAKRSSSPSKNESVPGLSPASRPQTATPQELALPAGNQAPQSTGKVLMESLPTPASQSKATETDSLRSQNLNRRAVAQTPEPKERAATIISGTPVTGPAPGQAGSGSATFSLPVDLEIPPFRSAPATIELFADYEVVLRRHPREPAVGHSEGENPPQRLEFDRPGPEHAATGRSIDRLVAAIPDHTRPQTIWITVPRLQYEQFKKEIQALGTIESEIRVPLLRDQPASQSDGHFRVKLTALPAMPGAAPNQPGDR